MKRLSLYLFLIFMAQMVHSGAFTVDEFQGMNTEESEILIPVSKSPDMDNCDLSTDGLSFERRLGQTYKFSITYATWTVKSFGVVKNNSYERLIVGYGNHVEAIDTAWSSAAMIHSTATVGYIWDLPSFQGNVYGTNGVDTMFYTDGNDRTDIPSANTATSLVFFNDTAWIANWPADHAGVAYSVFSDPTDWTTGTGPTDARIFSVADFGEKVVDLEVLGNSVLILCSKSIMKAVGYENPYQIVEVDKSIGCKSKGSVVTHLGFTYFLGSDGQYYKTDGTSVEDISSDEFRTAFDATALSQRSSNFNTISSQSEFELGISSNVDTSETPGTVRLPVGSTSYNTGIQWDSGTQVNVSTSVAPGSIAVSTRTVVLDDFTDGDFTNDPTWDVSTGDWDIVNDGGDDAMRCNNSGIVANRAFVEVSTAIMNTNGFEYRWDIKASDWINVEMNLYAYRDATKLSSGEFKHACRIFKLAGFTSFALVTSNGVGSSTQSGVTVSLVNNTNYVFKIRQSSTTFEFLVGDAVYQTLETPTYSSHPTSSSFTEFRFDYSDDGDLTDTVIIDDLVYSSLKHQSGHFISPIIDTTYNQPVWGLITAITTLEDDVSVNYYVRSSTDSLMGDDPAYVEQTLQTQITGIDNDRYVQFIASFSVVNLLNDAQIAEVALRYTTTGYYITPEISIADINAWGLFEVSETLNDGVMSYFTFSSNTIVSDGDLQISSMTTWTPQTKDTTIMVSTNTYVWAKATYSVTVSSQTPRLEAVTFNWVSGSGSSEDMTAYWDADRLYLGVMKSTSSSTNDGVFVFDPDLEAWWPYNTGVYPSALTTWNNKFLVASSTAGVVYSFLEGETDNGIDIDAYYTTKHLTATGGLSPFILSLTYLGFVYDRQDSGNLFVDTYLNGSSTIEDTYTLDMTGGDSIHFDLFKVPQSSNCRYFNFKIYNSGGSPFLFHSLFGETREFPIRFGVQQ